MYLFIYYLYIFKNTNKRKWDCNTKAHHKFYGNFLIKGVTTYTIHNTLLNKDKI